MVISDGIKIHFYGPPNKRGDVTTMIDISGTGCDRFKSLFDWYNLIKFCIEELNCNCSRIDEAVDDFYGESITYKTFFDICKQGFYSRSGAPKTKPEWIINDWNNYDYGCTINWYSKTSSIQLVSYNKMAEQKNKNNPIPNSPQWLRHEMRFYEEQANKQLKTFYNCLCYEVMGEFNENSTGFSKYVSSALFECLKLYEPTNDTNKARWKIHPGWNKFIGDISGIKFERPKSKNDKILKTKVYFEDSYSKFLLKMYLTFGKEYFNLWLRDFLFNNRNKLEPEDYIAVNELRHELGLHILNVNSIVIKAAEMQVLNEQDQEIINKYTLPINQDFINYELGKTVPIEKVKLITVGEEIGTLKEKIKNKIKKLQELLGEQNE